LGGQLARQQLDMTKYWKYYNQCLSVKESVRVC
jgi:hypothetical protein